MQYIDTEQNTDEWLESRRNFIGGSDVPSIMGVSPWRTVFQLWEEKLRICTPDQASKAYIFYKGHQLEIVARNKYELIMGFDTPPQVVQHDKYPWARVSTDLFNYNRGFLGEVKYQGKADWWMLKEQGVVPDKYYPQIQYQMFCTGLDECHFVGINKEHRIASVIVKFDIQYALKMIAWCEYFWTLVKNMTPPKMTQQDYKYLRRKQSIKDCNRIYDIDNQIEELLNERLTLQGKVLKIARTTRMAFEDKLLIRTSDFATKDLSKISEISSDHLSALGRSISDGIGLLILDNNNMHIKGAPNGTKEKQES